MGAFDGKTVVVRGGHAPQDTGHDIAAAFAREGANLAVVSWNKARAKDACELGRLHGVEVLPLWRVDDGEKDIEAAVDMVVDRLGRIDVLVNCALVAKAALVDELSTSDLRCSFEDNCLVPLAWMRACRAHLARNGGSVINLLSAASASGLPGTGALAASSQALAAVSRVAAREWAEEGIRVSMLESISVTGQFERWSREFSEDVDAALAQVGALGADTRFSNVGEACLHLAGNDASGSTVRVVNMDKKGS